MSDVMIVKLFFSHDNNRRNWVFHTNSDVYFPAGPKVVPHLNDSKLDWPKSICQIGLVCNKEADVDEATMYQT